MISAKHLLKECTEDFIYIYLFNPYSILPNLVLILSLYYGDISLKDLHPDPFNSQALLQHFYSLCLVLTICTLLSILYVLFHLIISPSLPPPPCPLPPSLLM